MVCRKVFLTTSHKTEVIFLWCWAVQFCVLVKARQEAKDVHQDLSWERLFGWWWSPPGQSLLEGSASSTQTVQTDQPCTQANGKLHVKYSLMSMRGCSRPAPSLLPHPKHSSINSGIMTLKGNGFLSDLAIRDFSVLKVAGGSLFLHWGSSGGRVFCNLIAYDEHLSTDTSLSQFALEN